MNLSQSLTLSELKQYREFVSCFALSCLHTFNILRVPHDENRSFHHVSRKNTTARILVLTTVVTGSLFQL